MNTTPGERKFKSEENKEKKKKLKIGTLGKKKKLRDSLKV